MEPGFAIAATQKISAPVYALPHDPPDIKVEHHLLCPQQVEESMNIEQHAEIDNSDQQLDMKNEHELALPKQEIKYEGCIMEKRNADRDLALKIKVEEECVNSIENNQSANCGRAVNNYQKSFLMCASRAVAARCELCSYNFLQKQHLDIHNERRHGDIVGDSKKSGEGPQSLADKYNNMKSDLPSHNGVQARGFQCSYCDKSYSRRYNLEVHTRTHTDDEPYSCDTCGKTFLHHGNLVSHIRVHTGEKERQCDQCGKRFNKVASYTDHMKRHKGLKVHGCDICAKRFVTVADLTGHKKRHEHMKPHVCNVCAKQFVTRRELASHKLVHSRGKPYACDVCGKTSRHRGHFIRHCRVHTGDKSYTCDVCGKTCSQRSDFIRHCRVHTDETVRKCDQCSKRFKHVSSYNRHMRKHKTRTTILKT